MDYVMVPVPEEHVVDVMQHVARLVAKASVIPWDDDSVAEFFDEVDEASRSVLSLVARSTTASKDLTEDAAGDALELKVREVQSIVRELHQATQQAKREPILVIREVSVVLRNQRTVKKRLFAMTEPVARAIRAHERASVDSAPGPAVDAPE